MGLLSIAIFLINKFRLNIKMPCLPRFFQKSMMGESLQENSSFAPLKIQEDYIFIVMIFIILSFGFFPKTWLELSEYAVAQFAHFKI